MRHLRRVAYVFFIVVVTCVATYALMGALLFISAGLGR